LFFSIRRRHTRSTRDWSSDVCSSDLRQSRINWVNPVLPGAPLRRFCNSFPAEWKFLCVSTRVSPPTMQFPKDFPEDQSKMRKIRSEERRVGKESENCRMV